MSHEDAGIGFTYNKTGGYGVLLATCNCCGGKLHLNITRHGYVTLDCEDLGDDNKAPCKHARHVGRAAGRWEWACACTRHQLERSCPNKQADALDERRRIREAIELAVYMAAMSRNFVILDLRETDYVDFEPAIMDAVNMTFTIDSVDGYRPYHVLVRRFYRAGENISSRFVFCKHTIARAVLFRYAKILLSLAARLAKRFPVLEWISERYEIA